MNSPPPREKVRDIAPTTLRLPPEMRDALTRLAFVNGRSLTQEITMRLRETLSAEAEKRPVKKSGDLRAADNHVRTGEAPPAYAPPELTDSQRLLITLFNTLAPDKQLALLTLLKR